MMDSNVIVDIGAYGWLHQGWNDSFYPEELPEDWQFMYYTGKYRTVIVPADLSESISKSELDALIEETAEQFDMTVELPDKIHLMDNAQIDSWLATWQDLDSKLVGFCIQSDNLYGMNNAILERIAAVNKIHIFGHCEQAGQVELFKNKNICFGATDDNINSLTNAQLALINQDIFNSDLKKLAAFIQQFVKQNNNHKLLYLYLMGNPPSPNLMEQIETLVNLIVPGQ